MATSLPATVLMIPPRVDLDGDDPSTLVRGAPEWLRRAGLVRGALEAHGCVAVECRRWVPPELRQRMLAAMAELFALPAEAKHRTGDADGPYRSFGVLLPYMEKRDSPACRHEAFAVLNAGAGGGGEEVARAFVARAWPNGNDRFLSAPRRVQTVVLFGCDLIVTIFSGSPCIQGDAGVDGRRDDEAGPRDPRHGHRQLRPRAPLRRDRRHHGRQLPHAQVLQGLPRDIAAGRAAGRRPRRPRRRELPDRLVPERRRRPRA
jgi:hypothetical protein